MATLSQFLRLGKQVGKACTHAPHMAACMMHAHLDQPWGGFPFWCVIGVADAGNSFWKLACTLQALGRRTPLLAHA